MWDCDPYRIMSGFFSPPVEKKESRCDPQWLRRSRQGPWEVYELEVKRGGGGGSEMGLVVKGWRDIIG